MTKYKRILIVLLALCVFALPVLSQEIFDAAKKGELAKVKALVQKNPDLVKSKNNEDDTPLHIAADAGHLEIARFLIQKGAKTYQNGLYMAVYPHWNLLISAGGGVLDGILNNGIQNCIRGDNFLECGSILRVFR